MTQQTELPENNEILCNIQARGRLLTDYFGKEN